MVTLEKWNSMYANVQAALLTLDDDKRAEADKSLAIDFQDHFAYQNQQAAAFASGLISQDVAQVCYSALGEVHSDSNGGWSKDTPLATKYLITKLISELLKQKIAA